MECKHTHKDAPENAICEDCGKPWASEYHISDECVKDGMITDAEVEYFKGMKDGVGWMIKKLKERENAKDKF